MKSIPVIRILLSNCVVALSVSTLFSLPAITSAERYREDLDLLTDYTHVIELTDSTGEARIAVTPDFQGKVMTSTATGLDGISNGWIDRKQMRADDWPNGGAYGGEDRLWIGPLGGQLSFYYQRIKPLSDQNWLVPAPLRTGSYDVTRVGKTHMHLQTELHLVNFQGTAFDLFIDRKLRIMEHAEAAGNLGVNLDGLKVVAYEAANQLTNIGPEKWKKETGLCGLWSLGMYPGTDKGVGIIPMGKGTRRSDVDETLTNLDKSHWEVRNGVVLYRADAKSWNKIGIPARLCGKVFGSYHTETGILTLIQYQFDPKQELYFNSTVSVQDNPYDGQPVQLYNNGPQDKPVADEATFYELESTGYMKELKPGETLSHWHRVYHVVGNEQEIDQVMRNLLGVSLGDVEGF